MPRPPLMSSCVSRKRRQLLVYQHATEIPMLLLSLVWVALFVLELARGLPPFLYRVGTAIWFVFLLDFAIRLAIAPKRSAFIRRNWLSALSLTLPALRLLRVARVAAMLTSVGGARSLLLVRVVARANRGMTALGMSFRRRGFGYVVSLSVLVTVVGAAGMLAFERENAAGTGLHDYPTALWWTAMMMTTMGSEYWPRSGAGRVLCLSLAIYAFAVFGYVAASLATYFIGRDTDSGAIGASERRVLEQIRADVASLRSDFQSAAIGAKATAVEAKDRIQ